MKIRTLLVLTSVAALFTCEPVPDFCGTGELYDPSCAFCYGSMPYSYCENEKRKYNPLLQGCVPTSGVIGTRCSDGRVVMSGTPCGGYTLTVSVTPEHSGTLSPPPAKTNFAAGEPLFLNAIPTDDDYEFAGWGGAVTSKEQSGTFDDVMKGVNPQLQIVAMFKPRGAGKLIVDASPHGVGEVIRTPDKDIYGDGEAVTVMAAGRQGSGYAFVRWAGADTSKTNPLRITMRESQTLVAIFTPVSHTLITAVSPAGAGAVYINDNAMLNDESRHVGAEVAVWGRANEGYVFSHWTGNDMATFAKFDTNSTTVQLRADALITANFKSGGKDVVEPPKVSVETYKLTVDIKSDGSDDKKGGSVSLNPDLDDYKFGIKVVAIAKANDGYEFAGWSGESTSKELNVEITMVENKWLTANFKNVNGITPSVTYTVTFDYNYEGPGFVTATTDGDGRLTPNALVAPTRTGYRFDGWFTDKTDGDKVTANMTFSENAIVYAHWTQITAKIPSYTLTTSVTTTGGTTGGGTISRIPNGNGSASNIYDSATVVQLTAAALSGYTFTGWTGDVNTGTTGGNTVTITMDRDKTVMANFAVNSGGGGGSAISFINPATGEDYKTVKINDVEWMAENLNCETTRGSWCYGGKEDSCKKYGRLYDWAAAMNIEQTYNSSKWSGSDENHQGVCPSGWHLPSNVEWTALVNYVESEQGTGSGTAAKYLKSKSGWYNDGNGTNDYGFLALPGGLRYYSGGSFNNAGYDGSWWTATDYDSGYAYLRGMDYNDDYLYEYGSYKEIGFSVRCVRDDLNGVR